MVQLPLLLVFPSRHASQFSVPQVLQMRNPLVTLVVLHTLPFHFSPTAMMQPYHIQASWSRSVTPTTPHFVVCISTTANACPSHLGRPQFTQVRGLVLLVNPQILHCHDMIALSIFNLNQSRRVEPSSLLRLAKLP